jgi:O-antigen/teichoic acid export membrane protein
MNSSLIAKNFTALLGSNFAIQAVRFLTIIFLARRLGTEVFGSYNYILLLVGIGFTLTEFGLKNLAIRELAQGRGSRRFINQIFRVRVLLALVSCTGIFLVATHAFGKSFSAPIILLALSLLVDAFLADFLLISKERLVPQALGNVLQALVLCIGSYFFIHSSDDFTLLSFIFLFSHVIWISLFWFSARDIKSALPDHLAVDQNIIRMTAGGVPFLIAQFLGSLQLGMDLLLLGQFHYQNMLGDYSAALKIVGVMVGVVSALMGAVQPRLAKYTHDFNSIEVRTLIFNTTRFVWLIVLPSLVGCWVMNHELVNWFFGDKYFMAARILRPLSLALVLFCVGLAPMHALFVAKKGKLLVKIATLNCLVSFTVISLLLLLKHAEFVAWGMVFVQLVYLTSGWSLFQFKGLVSFEDSKSFLVPLICMTLMLLLPIGSPLVKVCAGSIIYFLGLYLVGVWRRPWFKAMLS